jgi:hypothetical protein
MLPQVMVDAFSGTVLCCKRLWRVLPWAADDITMGRSQVEFAVLFFCYIMSPKCYNRTANLQHIFYGFASQEIVFGTTFLQLYYKRTKFCYTGDSYPMGILP